MAHMIYQNFQSSPATIDRIGGTGKPAAAWPLGSSASQGVRERGELSSGRSIGTFFVICADEHVVINDFRAFDGDSVTFLGQFSTRAELRSNISVTASVNQQAGDLIVTLENGVRAVFIGAAKCPETFIQSVVDFSSEGQSAFRLADRMNSASDCAIDAFVNSLGTEAYEATFNEQSSVILFANLRPTAFASVLNAFDEDEIDALLTRLGVSHMRLLLKEMTRDELKAFIEGLKGHALIALKANFGLAGRTGAANQCQQLEPGAQYDLVRASARQLAVAERSQLAARMLHT